MNIFKKIGVVLFLIVLPGLSSAMEATDRPLSFKKILTQEGLLDASTNYEVHLFWTSGARLKDCSSCSELMQVRIGGSKIYKKFQIYFSDFLSEPLPFFVRFITDELTLHTNSWLGELQKKYPTRFLISSVLEVERQITLRFPEFKDTISTVFENAQKGNPALASDVYRLIGMKTHDHFPASAGRTMRTHLQLSYTDVDNFTNGIEINPEVFLTALFATPPPSKILRKATSNDLISLRFTEPAASDDWDNEFCKDALKKWSAETSRYFFSYCPDRYNLIVTIQNKGDVLKMEEFVTASSFSTALIVAHTGPAFLKEFEAYFSSSLEYPSICAMSWSPLSFLEGNGVNLPSADCQGSLPQLVKVFLGYYKILECALVAQKLGEDHSSYLFLRKHIQERNPFFSSAYKEELIRYVMKKSSDSSEKGPEDIIKAYFKLLIGESPYLLPGARFPLTSFGSNTYLKLQDFLLSVFNISFELTESNLLDFYRRDVG